MFQGSDLFKMSSGKTYYILCDSGTINTTWNITCLDFIHISLLLQVFEKFICAQTFFPNPQTTTSHTFSTGSQKVIYNPKLGKYVWASFLQAQNLLGGESVQDVIQLSVQTYWTLTAGVLHLRVNTVEPLSQ